MTYGIKGRFPFMSCSGPSRLQGIARNKANMEEQIVYPDPFQI
jgi:hypothetical protein